MTVNHLKPRLPLAGLTATVLLLAAATGAQAATAPIKEIVSSHIGSEVDETTKGTICTVESKDKCQPGRLSSEPGGFAYAQGVAAAPDGNVFVADTINNRVQELTATGKFVLMFGKEVNTTTKGDVCTEKEIETEGVTCQAGAAGAEAGAFTEPHAIAVDPVSENLYVAEPRLRRVDEYTPTGQFVLMIGKEVNATTKANVCTETEVSEGVTCKAGAVASGAEHGAFVSPGALAVGPANHLLYVGDEHRVQEFDAEGNWIAEIRTPLESISSQPGSQVAALAVDNTSQVFLVYQVNFARESVREFDPSGNEIDNFHGNEIDNFLGIRDNPIFIKSIALDPAGRLAVLESEQNESRGVLYEVTLAGLHPITEFPGEGANTIAFDSENHLYAVSLYPGQEVIAYTPVPVGELVVTPAQCVPGAEHETDATLDCGLTGEVDPWGVSETVVWFQWGRTPSLGERTAPPIAVASLKSEGEEETPVKVSAPIAGVRPNETFYDELAGEDHRVKAPEVLTSAAASFTTPSVPPRIVGEPTAGFVEPSSAVFFGELNPENANTRYEFQYVSAAACNSLEEACPGMLQTTVLESPAYGEIGAVLEVSGLQPATKYRYRLAARNEHNEAAVNETGGSQLPEGTFETAPAPAVVAQTGAASVITTASALIAGIVNPNGQPSVYTFEMGIYNGASTRYGVVFSGSAGAGSEPVEEQLALSGLQPGTIYAYRIAIHFGDGTTAGSSATGVTLTFTTAGLPAVFLSPTPLAMLAAPNIAFPKAATSTTKALTNAQKLSNALKACKQKPKKQRAGCQRKARKKYAVTKTKAKKK